MFLDYFHVIVIIYLQNKLVQSNCEKAKFPEQVAEPLTANGHNVTVIRDCA